MNTKVHNFVITNIIETYPLIGGGTAEVARTKFGGGMQVGTPPLAVRLNIPENNGMAPRQYPKGWFVLGRSKSFHKIDQELKTGTLSDELLHDIYFQAWQSEVISPGSTT